MRDQYIIGETRGEMFARGKTMRGDDWSLTKDEGCATHLTVDGENCIIHMRLEIEDMATIGQALADAAKAMS